MSSILDVSSQVKGWIKEASLMIVGISWYFFVRAHASCGCRDEAHSGLNMVLVEGGPKAVRAYVKLMTLRIRWGEEEYGGGDSDSDRSVPSYILYVADGRPGLVSLALNRCVCIVHILTSK